MEERNGATSENRQARVTRVQVEKTLREQYQRDVALNGYIGTFEEWWLNKTCSNFQEVIKKPFRR